RDAGRRSPSAGDLSATEIQFARILLQRLRKRYVRELQFVPSESRKAIFEGLELPELVHLVEDSRHRFLHARWRIPTSNASHLRSEACLRTVGVRRQVQLGHQRAL